MHTLFLVLQKRNIKVKSTLTAFLSIFILLILITSTQAHQFEADNKSKPGITESNAANSHDRIAVIASSGITQSNDLSNIGHAQITNQKNHIATGNSASEPTTLLLLGISLVMIASLGKKKLKMN